jgi:hypothetical protein
MLSSVAGEDGVGDKIKAGATDVRKLFDYVPILNLLQSAKILKESLRSQLNAILTAISVVSSIGLNILKIVGIATAILTGPIGWLISAGLFALSAVLSAIAYGIANRNPDQTWEMTGYQCNSKPLTPEMFDAKDKNRIRTTAALCESLKKSSLPRDRAVAQPYPEIFEQQKDALEAAGFHFGGVCIDESGNTVQRFHNGKLGVGFALVISPDGNSHYFIPQLETNHARRITVLANAVGPWSDARTEAFEAAFRAMLTIFGENVSLAGICEDAIIAQYLGLKYGSPTFCYNAHGIGPVKQEIIGTERIAKNAQYVSHFTIPHLLSRLQKFANGVDMPATILLGYRSPGNFGHRYEILNKNVTNITTAIDVALSNSSPVTP